VITKTTSYAKMPTGVQTWARAASVDDDVMFDPPLWELDPTGNFLRKVAAAAGKEGSTGAAASRADLVALLQAAAAVAELRS
jgi:hypothetical protein